MTRITTQIPTTLILLSLLVLTLAACGEKTGEVIAAFESGGLDVGPESDVGLIYIGAPQDTSVKVNGRDVLIYRFVRRDDLREGIIAINNIMKAGTGLWGYDIENPEASYHDKGLYLVYYGDHPDADRIREAIDTGLNTGVFELNTE
jgi:hypothetical protein